MKNLQMMLAFALVTVSLTGCGCVRRLVRGDRCGGPPLAARPLGFAAPTLVNAGTLLPPVASNCCPSTQCCEADPCDCGTSYQAGYGGDRGIYAGMEIDPKNFPKEGIITYDGSKSLDGATNTGVRGNNNMPRADGI